MINYKQKLCTVLVFAAISTLDASDTQRAIQLYAQDKKTFDTMSDVYVRSASSLNTAFFTGMANNLHGNVSIKRINFTYSTVGDKHLKILLPLLQTLHQLEELKLVRSDLGNEGIIALCDTFLNQKPTSLKIIDIRGNEYNGAATTKVNQLNEKHPGLVRFGLPLHALQRFCENKY